ncbi:MAG: tRNA lysidine(34) synthetase TilS [Rhodospirillales bacterium]|nr:MAG: tRNA lysidine(34) synthetase TilS [Rhodospirillales bacterium]
MPGATSRTSATPVAAAEFAALMRPFEPFERHPLLAVAVSGGRDSLALALLAREWARGRGGDIVALVVDHGLRRESADEAARVRGWMAARGIACETLAWRPSPPRRTGIQTAARDARYALLFGWCVDNGALHLLTAHQADDQAETHALRAARGSGPDGLAGMSAVVERPGARLLRPLLPVPRARLTATLLGRGQAWLDDPSNADPRFARAKLRRDGLPAPRVVVLRRVGRLALERARMDARVAAAMAGCAWLHPLGGAYVDAGAFAALDAPVAARVLARLVVAVAGAEHAPRLPRIERAAAALRRAGTTTGLTVGGCRVVWRGGGWLVAREAGGATDGRFTRSAADLSPSAGAPVVGLARPIAEAWPATPGLAVLTAGLGPVSRVGGVDIEGGRGVPEAGAGPSVCFRPRQPAAGAPFVPCIAAPDDQIERTKSVPGAS